MSIVHKGGTFAVTRGCAAKPWRAPPRSYSARTPIADRDIGNADVVKSAPGNAAVPRPPSEPKAAVDFAVEDKQTEADRADIPDGAGPAVAPAKGLKVVSVPSTNGPKPVQVTSVPQTPAYNGTPAGDTPRPELKLDEAPELVRMESTDLGVMTGVREPHPSPKASLPTEDAVLEPITDLPPVGGAPSVANGDNTASSSPAKMTGALPLSEPAAPATDDAPVISPAVSNSAPGESSEPAATTSEKHKLDEEVALASAEPDAKKSKPNGDKAPSKVGRPRKGSQAKRTFAPPGRTERKTRSQGPV